jgi:hypothetical protein
MAVAALALTAGLAFAQPAARGKIKGKGDGNIRVSDTDRGTTDLGVIDIEGRIYKPSVFYVLARSDLSYKGLEFKQNYTDRIVKGALRRPF